MIGTEYPEIPLVMEDGSAKNKEQWAKEVHAKNLKVCWSSSCLQVLINHCRCINSMCHNSWVVFLFQRKKYWVKFGLDGSIGAQITRWT